MKPIFCLLFSVLGVAGCASYMSPPEARNLSLVGVSSSGVEIYRPRFLSRDGQLVLEAYVTREFRGKTTAESHVDIVYLDAQRRILAEERANVRPHNLPESTRMPRPHAYFVQAIQPPPGTASVEVRAHDEAHPR